MLLNLASGQIGPIRKKPADSYELFIHGGCWISHYRCTSLYGDHFKSQINSNLVWFVSHIAPDATLRSGSRYPLSQRTFCRPFAPRYGSASWRQFSAGNYHSAGIPADGTLWAMGDNANGNFGVADTIRRSSPIQVGNLSSELKISDCGRQLMALRNDGTLWGISFRLLKVCLLRVS